MLQKLGFFGATTISVDGAPEAINKAHQARSIAEDVNEVCQAGGIGSLSLAVMLLAESVEILATKRNDD